MINKKNLLLLSLVTASVGVQAKKEKSNENQQPNVVIIYGDDVGYADVGVYGSKLIPTPNIDRMANEGIVFTDGHCTASTCTPSRFSMLTGICGFRYNANILPPGAPLLIPTNITTLPKVFQQAGYATACIGKWHLGLGSKGHKVDYNAEVAPGPNEIGFDYSYILPSTNDRVPCVYLENHKVEGLKKNDPLYIGRKKSDVEGHDNTQYPDGKVNPEAMTYYKSMYGHNNSVINGIGRIGYQSGGKSALWNDEDMSDVFVAKAKKYIKKHKKKPFFLYYAAQNIHVPRTPHKRFQGTTTLGYRGDSMVEFDWVVGEILKTLKENGLDENTIVIFSSDNGPVFNDGYDDGCTVKTSTKEVDRGHDPTGVYTGGKYRIQEGGTRVPFIIRWPGKIKPAKSNALVSQIDFLKSFATYLNVDIPSREAKDSRDMRATFLGEAKENAPYIVEEAPGNQTALRRGAWKYIPNHKRGKRVSHAALYNVKNDPSEKNNLIEQFPSIAKEMENLLLNIKR
ncbi:arylsulfatase [Halosquirtibacter xylanolyticus]|uniref:sulfatase family protein n=1 Tax=Halosquirtibacter xylanolyticus TaxID=3374599 RepID=UPI00374920ED|nr:arylsulfatase [Prolixibacteraceae bacterium]